MIFGAIKAHVLANGSPATTVFLEDAEIDRKLTDSDPDMPLSPNGDKSSNAHSFIFRDLTIDEILRSQESRAFHGVCEDDSVYECIGLMSRLNVGCVMVQDKRGEYTGIFSERDYLNKVALRGLSSREITVKEIMTKNVVFVTSNETASACMDLMTTKRFRHLPVRHSATKEVVGMISIGDLVATVRSNSVKL